jgi:hypothetical protein
MRPLALVPLLCLAACITAPGPQSATVSDCAAATFADDPLIGAAFTDKFNGRYWNNGEQVTVWREGQRLYIGGSRHMRVQLKPAAQRQGAGAFATAAAPLTTSSCRRTGRVGTSSSSS